MDELALFSESQAKVVMDILSALISTKWKPYEGKSTDSCYNYVLLEMIQVILWHSLQNIVQPLKFISGANLIIESDRVVREYLCEMQDVSFRIIYRRIFKIFMRFIHIM